MKTDTWEIYLPMCNRTQLHVKKKKIYNAPEDMSLSPPDQAQYAQL